MQGEREWVPQCACLNPSAAQACAGLNFMYNKLMLGGRCSHRALPQHRLGHLQGTAGCGTGQPDTQYFPATRA